MLNFRDCLVLIKRLKITSLTAVLVNMLIYNIRTITQWIFHDMMST